MRGTFFDSPSILPKKVKNRKISYFIFLFFKFIHKWQPLSPSQKYDSQYNHDWLDYSTIGCFGKLTREEQLFLGGEKESVQRFVDGE